MPLLRIRRLSVQTFDRLLRNGKVVVTTLKAWNLCKDVALPNISLQIIESKDNLKAEVGHI